MEGIPADKADEIIALLRDGTKSGENEAIYLLFHHLNHPNFTLSMASGFIGRQKGVGPSLFQANLENLVADLEAGHHTGFR